MKYSSTQFDTIVLGAGASGLFCAFTAARRGRRVLVLEKANKVGKKILMSGGGRCNFTNYSIEPDNFISANPHFCKAALKRYTQWDFIALVEQHNIAYEERKHGQLFCEKSAKDIVNMLLDECEQAGVEIMTNCQTTDIKTLATTSNEEDTTARYQLTLEREDKVRSLSCHSLVIATGALSVPTLGGSGQAYTIAEQFGLSLVPRQAGLVPFMFSDATKSICERLSGLAHEVSVSCNGQVFRENLLFTHRGISGPVILQISNYWQPGDEITINLLPDTDPAQWLIDAKTTRKGLLRNVLQHHFAKTLTHELEKLWWAQSADKPLADYSDKDLMRIGNTINQWTLKPSATEGYRTAEVTLGGVDTDCISSKTMEAKDHPGLYFIGEALDVTGHLGGYNFQWAWSSGYSAGLVV